MQKGDFRLFMRLLSRDAVGINSQDEVRKLFKSVIMYNEDILVGVGEGASPKHVI